MSGTGPSWPVPPAMKRALEAARHAAATGEVPVAAVVVCDGKVVACEANATRSPPDPTGHAEVRAIREAARVLGRDRLTDCDLYVTLEPCAMCAGALVNARLGHLVFGAVDPKAGAVTSHFGLLDGAPLNHRVPFEVGPHADECSELLRGFFRARR